MTPATRSRRSVLPSSAIAVLRLTFAVLAFVGCGVSFARAALPHFTSVPAGARVTTSSSVSPNSGDDLTVSLDQARLPNNGTRRVTLSQGPALPLGTSGHEWDAPRAGGRRSGRVSTPANFVPGPPFHPPRAS